MTRSCADWSAARSSAEPAARLAAAGALAAGASAITTVSFSDGIRTVSPPAAARIAISESFDTRSPLRSLTSCTTPAAVAGTSIVALSVSSVMSGVSGCDPVARLDQHLDDLDVVEIPEIRDPLLDELAQGTASVRPCGDASASASATTKRTAWAPSMTRWS